ncbi:uncharacterized protein BDZ83DRAFT_610944 [Colletotrichum acutatum]|uniref:Uncharacterized protein n=1 Tax=Glomerella acutata TaxID=27357 RepID=A0AAD8USJ6_GLOAC|nr:uncharacterized protein BDZ83DRAFT_610944 [Colletotrichum acutatum]KAK1728032.1 hypothetical protein BDZ83DRAFT_610944 [Colletotrichum acutatum]
MPQFTRRAQLSVRLSLFRDSLSYLFLLPYLSLSVELFCKLQPWPVVPFHRMNYLSRTRKLGFRCNFRPATCFRPVDLLLSVWEEESGKVAFRFPCLGRVIKCYHDDIILLSPIRFELLLNQKRTSVTS